MLHGEQEQGSDECPSLRGNTARLLASCVFLAKTRRERNLKIIFRQRKSSANTSNPSALLGIPLLPSSTAYPQAFYKIKTALFGILFLLRIVSKCGSR